MKLVTGRVIDFVPEREGDAVSDINTSRIDHPDLIFGCVQVRLPIRSQSTESNGRNISTQKRHGIRSRIRDLDAIERQIHLLRSRSGKGLELWAGSLPKCESATCAKAIQIDHCAILGNLAFRDRTHHLPGAHETFFFLIERRKQYGLVRRYASNAPINMRDRDDARPIVHCAAASSYKVIMRADHHDTVRFAGMPDNQVLWVSFFSRRSRPL